MFNSYYFQGNENAKYLKLVGKWTTVLYLCVRIHLRCVVGGKEGYYGFNSYYFQGNENAKNLKLVTENGLQSCISDIEELKDILESLAKLFTRRGKFH